MNLEILKEKEIPLLKRKRVTLRYNSQKQVTPSRKEVLKEVSKKLGAKIDTIAIRHIYSQFGESSSKIIAHVYKDKKTMDAYEDKKLMEKQKIEEPKVEAQNSETPVEQ